MAATGLRALGEVLAEVREATGVERTDAVSLAVDEVVIVVVVVIVAGGAAVAPSAASRFLASFAIRSGSPPLAPANLNPPIPPMRLPTVGTAAAGAETSGGVASVLGGALASGVTEAR